MLLKCQTPLLATVAMMHWQTDRFHNFLGNILTSIHNHGMGYLLLNFFQNPVFLYRAARPTVITEESLGPASLAAVANSRSVRFYHRFDAWHEIPGSFWYLKAFDQIPAHPWLIHCLKHHWIFRFQGPNICKGGAWQRGSERERFYEAQGREAIIKVIIWLIYGWVLSRLYTVL